MNTAFSQLGLMSKSAYAPAAPNPYVPQQPQQAAAPAAEPGMTGTDKAMMAADLGLGFVPVVGSIWNGGRALWHAAHGNWGDAAMNASMAGLSMIGAGGVAGAAMKGGAAGVKALSGGAKVLHGAAQGTGMVAKGAQGVIRAGNAANSLKAVGSAKPLWNGTQGVNVAGYKGVGAMGPLTTGKLAYGGAATAATVVPGLALPNAGPSIHPAINITRQIATNTQPNYGNSVVGTMANEMNAGGSQMS